MYYVLYVFVGLPVTVIT